MHTVHIAEKEIVDLEELGIKGEMGILENMKTRHDFLKKRKHKIVFYYRAMQFTLVIFREKVSSWTSIQRLSSSFVRGFRQKRRAVIILENCAGLTDLCVRAAKRLKRGT